MRTFRSAVHVATLALIAVTACSACSAAGGTVIVTTTVTSNPIAAGGGSADAAPPAPSTDEPNPTGTVSDAPSPGVSSPPGDGPSDPATPSSATSASAPPKPVHVSTFEGDGKTYGVGMAVMVLLSAAPTDSSAFTKAAKVTVNGTPANGAWFWQQPTLPGYKMEALYREKGYWPAHSTIAVDLPLQGLSAGAGLAYDDSLTVTFKIGASHISYVNSAQHQMTVTDDSNVVQNFPVSLGAATTPTYDGTKVVMEKKNPVEMKSDPGEADPYDIMVPWSVRITNSGEFVHAASWNTGNIGSHNTSHGCTNLNLSDAEWFYKFSQIGDVVRYTDANPKGTVQPSWDGWGWWNLSWSQWSRGGELLNH